MLKYILSALVCLTLLVCGNACNNQNIVIGSKLKQVSVGVAGIWGTDTAGEVYCLANGTWKLIPGSMKQVSVGGTIWSLNFAGGAYYRLGISSGAPCGTSWGSVGGCYDQISVSPKGHVWAVYGGYPKYIYWRNGAKLSYPRGSSFTRITGYMRHISVGYSGVWAITPTYEVVHRKGTFGDTYGVGTEWVVIAGQPMERVVSSNGAVFGFARNHAAYYRFGVASDQATGSEWRTIEHTVRDFDHYEPSQIL